MRPPFIGRCAAIDSTEMPFGFTRDDLAEAEGIRIAGRVNVTLATRPLLRSRLARNSSSGVSRPE